MANKKINGAFGEQAIDKITLKSYNQNGRKWIKTYDNDMKEE